MCVNTVMGKCALLSRITLHFSPKRDRESERERESKEQTLFWKFLLRGKKECVVAGIKKYGYGRKVITRFQSLDSNWSGVVPQALPDFSKLAMAQLAEEL